MACLSEAATPEIGNKFCACVRWRRLLYNSVKQCRDSACQCRVCRGSVLEKGAGWVISGLRSVAHAHGTYGVCTMPTVYVQHLAVYLRWFTDDWTPTDTRAWPRIFEQEGDSRQSTDERGCREKWRGDRLEMYGHGRLPTLTDAYRRWFSQCGAFAPSACERVNPYPSVTGPLMSHCHHFPQQVILLTSTQCDTLLYRAQGSTILNSQIHWMSRVSSPANQKALESWLRSLLACFRWYDRSISSESHADGIVFPAPWMAATIWLLAAMTNSAHLTVQNERFPTCLYNTSSNVNR